MTAIQIAQVGCGGMGLRHLYGQAASQKSFGSFDYISVCDVSESAANYVANQAEKLLGKRPNVYTDIDRMLSTEKTLDAIDIVTDAGQHHIVASKAAQSGIHIATEKPMGITVRACIQMIDLAEKNGIVLSVSENYRRDPLNRLNKAIIDSKALGEPRLFLDISARGTRSMPHGTAWRHLKTSGGYMLDYAVHNADLLMYFMGSVDRVYSETQLWEKTRFTKESLEGKMKDFYGHREKIEIEKSGEVECTSEDMASGVIRFKSGAMANFLNTIAAPGQTSNANMIYFDNGSIKLGGSRSGKASEITYIGEEQSIPESDILALVPDFSLDDMTSSVFGGDNRISSYEMEFSEVDAKIIALELEDFAEAIRSGNQPEVTGQIGLQAVALTYAFLESGLSHQPVCFDDIETDRINFYQREINESFELN